MRALAVASAVAVAVALAGCSSTPPEATPPSTTTTTTTAPPTTIASSPTTSTTLTPPTTAPTTTTTLPASIGFLAQAASFATAATGYVLGDVRCGRVVCLALRTTVNGGSTWTRGTPPGPPSARNLTAVTGLVFADVREGWAFGRTLWATHNGAVGWTRIKIGGTVDALATGGGEAYALVDPCHALTCVTPDHLERSPIGEDAWTKVPGKTATFSRSEPELVVQGTTVFVLTQASGSAAASLASSVNGAPFSRLPIPCQAASPAPGDQGVLPVSSLAADGPNDVAVACVGDPGAGSARKQVFLSTDGGHVFTRLADPMTVGISATLALPSPSTVVLASGSAGSYVSRLVAPTQTWALTLGLSDGGVGLTNLTFVDPQHGAVIDGRASLTLAMLHLQNSSAPFGRLYLSADGGATWHVAQIPA